MREVVIFLALWNLLVTIMMRVFSYSDYLLSQHKVGAAVALWCGVVLGLSLVPLVWYA